jgi:hypothetical protein
MSPSGGTGSHSRNECAIRVPVSQSIEAPSIKCRQLFQRASQIGAPAAFSKAYPGDHITYQLLSQLLNTNTHLNIMSNSDDGKPKLSLREIIEKSAASAARGGIAGACAMGANVAALMWIRTTVGVLLINFAALCFKIRSHF